MAALTFQGVHATLLADTSEEIDAEGALSSGKTTVCLWKVRQSCADHPGIHWYVGRYSDSDTQQKLRPAAELVFDQFDPGDIPSYEAREKSYRFANGSKIFAFGLKAPDAMSRYAKLRGLGVAGIYLDQGEELPGDIAKELRARLRQPGYPHQLLLSPNPMDDESWLAKEFPENNADPSRKYYSISLYDNAHNLSPDTIRRIERAYPPTHAKYRTMVMGRRGVNVIGDPVYESTFNRLLHVRPLMERLSEPILCVILCGKSYPTALFAQQPYAGGWSILAGIQGVSLFLQDFLPLVVQYAAKWFGDHRPLQLCTDGSTTDAADRYTLAQLIRSHKLPGLRQRANSNAPDVRLAMIERLAAYMRKRNADGQEAFGINADPDRWIRVKREGVFAKDFLADALEAGYVWNEHPISVGNKELRQPKADDMHEHAGFALELLELNFAAGMLTREQRDQRAKSTRAAHQELDPTSSGAMAYAR